MIWITEHTVQIFQGAARGIRAAPFLCYKERTQVAAHPATSTLAMPSLTSKHRSNPSEKHLAKLCERSFLSLWSYPHLYRNQSRPGSSPQGKEICDLTAICGHHIILFSDKSCAFSHTNDCLLGWSRWYRNAILDSAKQVFGAERWLTAHPDRVFVDPNCTSPLPVAIPRTPLARFHRVIIARGTQQPCRAYFKGGDGSLIISNTVSRAENASRPFVIGDIDPTRQFIHVLDDASLDVVMDELDTITDYIDYLQARERLLRSEARVFAASEKDLLACYLANKTNDAQSAFGVPAAATHILCEPGHWDRFVTSSKYASRQEANKCSYVIDDIISSVAEYARKGTLRRSTHPGIASAEPALRELALLSRHDRRMLGYSFLDAALPASGDDVIFRQTRPRTDDRVLFLLAFFPLHTTKSEAARDNRLHNLEEYCLVLHWRDKGRHDIVAIATEAGPEGGRSFDVLMIHKGKLSAEMAAEAAAIQRRRDILRPGKLRAFGASSDEFPDDGSEPPVTMLPLKEHLLRCRGPGNRVGRNDPCPCGSTKKYKKCCGGGRP